MKRFFLAVYLLFAGLVVVALSPGVAPQADGDVQFAASESRGPIGSNYQLASSENVAPAGDHHQTTARDGEAES